MAGSGKGVAIPWAKAKRKARADLATVVDFEELKAEEFKASIW